MPTPPLLELHLHLVTGGTHRFRQNDPDRVTEILRQVTRKVFTQPNLIIAAEDGAHVYHGAGLAGISVIMEPLPGELLLLDPISANVCEITETEFQEKQRTAPPIVSGQPFLLLMEIEMMSGRRIWVEQFIPRAAGALDERAILRHAFTSPNLVCYRRSGGISIWNRSQMMSITYAPKPEAPAASWHAESMSPLYAGSAAAL